MTNVETKLIVPSAIEKYLKGERIILELKVTTAPPTANKRKATMECTATFTFSGAHPAITNQAWNKVHYSETPRSCIPEQVE